LVYNISGSFSFIYFYLFSTIIKRERATY